MAARVRWKEAIGGIKGISDQTVDFGATDGFMTDEQLKAAKGGSILHIPTAIGALGETMAVNDGAR